MKRTLPPIYFFALIVLGVLLHFFLPARSLIVMPWRLLGFLPIVAGAILTLVADAAFKRHQTTVKPFEESTALVTSGAFRLSRNPMYLGMTLVLAGGAMLSGAATPWMLVAAFPILMDRLFVGPEEAMLETKFGDVFQSYKSHTRRWI